MNLNCVYIILSGIIVFSSPAFGMTETVRTEEKCPVIEMEITYLIKEGDRLFNIGEKFGSGHFWEAIYIMNAHIITNPNLIYPGQLITIPSRIAGFYDSEVSLREVFYNPFCNDGEIAEIQWDTVDSEFLYLYDQHDIASFSANLRDIVELQKDSVELQKDSDVEIRTTNAADTIDFSIDEEALRAFREAFNELVRQEEERRREQAQAESERSMFIEIDGMIHDDTHTKIGRDFYEIFYANWQSPPDASNYSIRITEQPAPNLGTVIAVMVDNTVTFRSRLQPRYDLIEEASQYAVSRTYLYLQDYHQQFKIY